MKRDSGSAAPRLLSNIVEGNGARQPGVFPVSLPHDCRFVRCSTPSTRSPGPRPTMNHLVDKRETRIRGMFAHIAPSYDFLNHLLSFNVDRYWRWRTTRLVPPAGTGPVFDLCTGTGDLALAYDR